MAKLIELVAHLRGPEGCAWDRAQTFDSMKGLLLEEAYEVIDAVNGRTFEGLEDELGDLFFLVVFYARLAEEQRRFALDDVIEHLHVKLVRRHPHVFGDTRARTAEEALASWLTVKEREQRDASSKEQETRSPEPDRAEAGRKKPEAENEEGQGSTPSPGPCGPPSPPRGRGQANRHAPPTAPTGQPVSLLDGIPKVLPATLEAYELGVRAAEVGFDWTKVDDLLDKVAEELVELRHELVPRPVCDGSRAAGPGSQSSLEEEVGDLLFAASNLARYLGSDPESCLRRANQKFKERFRALEQEVAKLGKRVRDCAPEELDRLWNVVKRQEVRSKEQEAKKEEA